MPVAKSEKSLAVVMGIECEDREDLQLEMSPSFWHMIEERRKQPTVSLKKAEKILFDD